MNELPEWITVHEDRRISYYPSGVVGEGPRKQIRGGKSALEAMNRARNIVREVSNGASLAITMDSTWTTLLTAWESHHVGILKEGTYRRRMSAINAHILPAIGHVRLVTTDETTLNNVIDHVVNSGSGPDNYDSVMQTLSVVSLWGMTRKYVAEGCFGSDKSVSAAKKDGFKRTGTPQNSNDGDGDHGISMADCPSWDDVVALSNEVANIIAGRTSDYELGQRYARAVRVCAGTGLRLTELLAITSDRVDFKRGTIKVDRQLDRYVSWLPGQEMPTAPTKTGVTRHARVWSKVADDLAALIEEAGSEGVLVPPYDGIAWWADAWGRALSSAAKRIGWAWVPHYLRHHYGSFSIADREDGGMGMHYTKVQKSMGHSSPEITLRVYAHSVEGETEGWIS